MDGQGRLLATTIHFPPSSRQAFGELLLIGYELLSKGNMVMRQSRPVSNGRSHALLLHE